VAESLSASLVTSHAWSASNAEMLRSMSAGLEQSATAFSLSNGGKPASTIVTMVAERDLRNIPAT